MDWSYSPRSSSMTSLAIPLPPGRRIPRAPRRTATRRRARGQDHAEHTACLDRVGTSLPRCSGLSRPPVPFPPRSRPPLPFGATLNARLQLRIHTRSPLESHFFCAALHVGLPAETPALSASATGSRWSQPKGDESNKADVISEKIRGSTWQRASTRGTMAK